MSGFRCRIKDEKEIYFIDIEEMYKFDRYNEITHIDCSYCQITKIKNLPNSLQFLNRNSYVYIDNDFLEDKINCIFNKMIITDENISKYLIYNEIKYCFQIYKIFAKYLFKLFC